MAYDASVKFNSAVAERRVSEFARSIGNLRTRLRESANAAKAVGGAVRGYTADVNRASTRTRVLTRDIENLRKAARAARTDVVALAKALNSGTLRGASAAMRQAASGADRVSASSRRAATSARTHERAARAAGTATGSYGRQAKAAAASTDTLDRSVKKANQSMLGMASGLVRVRNLTAFLAGGFGIAFLVETADTAKLASARLNLVAESEQNLVYLEKQLFDVSARTRSGYKENVALFTKMAMAGKTYGISQQQSLQVTENVTKALKISGATAGETASATQQLSQAFSSGRIQGDELKSVLENAPRISQILSKELSHLGINAGNLRDKAAEGAIGIKELVEALGGSKITKDLNDEFAKIPVTIGDALTVAKVKFTQFIGELDKATGISSAVAGVILLVADNFDKIAVAAGVAAIAIASAYVPAMLGAIKVSKVFALVNLAAYGIGVRKSFAGMAGSVGLFSGVLKKSATSTLPAWRQVVGNVFGAVSLNAGSLFNVFKATVGRIPLVFAAVTAAGYIFANDTKIIAGEAATAGDYMVTGFQIVGEKIASIFGWISDTIGSVVRFAVDMVLGLVDKMTRAVASAAYFAKYLYDANPLTGSKAFSFEGAAAAGKEGYQKGGVRQLFGDAVKGGEWNKRANARAARRANMGTPGSEVTGSMPPSSGDDKKDKKGKKGGTSEIDTVRSALESLRGTLDETEKARSEFNDGMKTLKQSFDFGLIKADEYARLMKDLAGNVFPGLKDEIKDLTEENWKLNREMEGASEGTIKFEEGTKELKKQIDQIDAVIAKQGDVSGVLKDQRSVLQGQVTEYGKLIQDNEVLKKQAEDRKKAEQEITKLIDEASNRLYEMLTNRISDALKFSSNSFKNFWKDVLGGARDTIASVLGAYVFEPIRKKFRDELETAFKKGRTPGGGAPGSGGLKSSDITGAWSSMLPANDNNTTTSTGETEIVVNGSTTFFEQLARGYKDVWSDVFSSFKGLFKGLGKLFGDLGINLNQLGFNLGKVIAGGQLGSMAAGATGGNGLGGAVGGALGQAGGEAIGKMLGGTLGKFAGPLGAIAGGILGGAVTKLFAKKKYGTSVITGGAEGDVSTTGNSASRREASLGSAGEVQSGLNDVADRLGGKVGSFRVSLGKYKDDYRVSSTGRTGKLKTKYGDVTDFGDDQAAAVAYAIKVAIEQGAITGLRAGTQALLRNAKDLEAGLQDALDFEDVFSRYKNMTDPIGFAMENLGKEFTRLSDLFKKAGATSEEWAQLGAVFQNEISEVIKSQIDSLISFRDDLIGGDKSFKSPTDRLKIANDKFKGMEDRVKAGEFVNQDEFTSAGQALQDLARQIYGSTPEFQAYQQRLLDATNKLITNAEAEEKTLQPVIDAINNQGKAAIDASKVTNEYLAAIAAATASAGYTPANNIMTGGGKLNFMDRINDKF